MSYKLFFRVKDKKDKNKIYIQLCLIKLFQIPINLFNKNNDKNSVDFSYNQSIKESIY